MTAGEVVGAATIAAVLVALGFSVGAYAATYLGDWLAERRTSVCRRQAPRWTTTIVREDAARDDGR